MKIVRFLGTDGNVHLGERIDDNKAFLLKGNLFEESLEPGGQVVEILRYLPPLEPRVIFGIGRNYKAHAEETGAEVPKVPVIFVKNPASVQGHKEPIVLPSCCMEPPEVDYEVELAVIIGSKAKDVSVDNALKYVFGYCVANDVSARRWQKYTGGQWTKGKSFDTFCPLGPAIITKDEVLEPQNLVLYTKVNGQQRQYSNTSMMIFSIAELISFISMGTTLLPGTVILTGTPEGVGFARNPPLYLQPGDSVEVTVEGIGTLINPVVAE